MTLWEGGPTITKWEFLFVQEDFVHDMIGLFDLQTNQKHDWLSTYGFKYK